VLSLLLYRAKTGTSEVVVDIFSNVPHPDIFINACSSVHFLIFFIYVSASLDEALLPFDIVFIFALNSCHGNNVAVAIDDPHFCVKYHGSHILSTLAYVLSLGFDELYVVHLHHTRLVAS
jgi:hypothetical protein